MSHVPFFGVKTCRKCGEEKDVTDFRVFSRYGQADRMYRRSWCMACDRAYLREWRQRNPGYAARKSKAYRAL